MPSSVNALWPSRSGGTIGAVAQVLTTIDTTDLRSQVELDADNYDFRIQGILASWRFISVSG